MIPPESAERLRRCSRERGALRIRFYSILPTNPCALVGGRGGRRCFAACVRSCFVLWGSLIACVVHAAWKRGLLFAVRAQDGRVDKMCLDTTGDGFIDSVERDTTGDGAVDTFEAVPPVLRVRAGR